MKLLNAGYQIIDPIDPIDHGVGRDYILKKIERVGRICYVSEAQITNESASGFVERLVRNGHHAMLEHASMTVIFTVDRGISHELVRHRMASFAQESTRYCNYSKGKFDEQVSFIKPFYLKEGTPEYDQWKTVCQTAEQTYLWQVTNGMKPEEARALLPNSLKTTVAVTANLREWRHILALRACGVAGRPHPQMLEVMVPLLNELKSLWLPEIFGDLNALEDKAHD